MSEWSAVQNPLLQYAEQVGWTRVPPAEAEQRRGGRAGLFFLDELPAALFRLNSGLMTDARAEDIVRQLRLLPADLRGNRDALDWLRGKGSIFVEEDGQERNVRLIHFDDPAQNRYHVSWEWRYEGQIFGNRADVVFLINGIPVAVAELKAAEKRNAIEEAVVQLRRYHRETPELVQHAQIVEASQLFDVMYGVTWNLSRKNLVNWRDEGPAGDYETRVKAFFDRERLLRVLREYVLFREEEGGGLTKLILRQHQTRAVERVLERTHDPDKRRGLVWHTQGSGKTLTMITIAAHLLRVTVRGEKPTVLMLIDRIDLEEQLWKNLAASGLATYHTARSKTELVDLLRADTRGLVVAMIHKFDDMPAQLNERSSVVVLVDEAHRTTGGTLGNYLMAALPNATYIGFTGTPIDRLSKGKGTFKTFGVEDPQGYLDKYEIAESIEDQTTVRLHYALAPNDLRVERETLEQEFLKLTEAEGVADVEELNAILDRAVRLKELMKSRERIDKVAAFVAQHFRDVVEPLGYKAFLVGVDREACALYKEALDRYLPADYSRVVISPAHNDPPELAAHHLDKAAEKKVRDAFRDAGELPKILIVTEKLLTGFDAPVLYTLYLDKPMRDHVLLQTIARVNRPYEDAAGKAKPCGVIVDFVGIFERLEDALAFDSDVVASVIENLDVLKRLFAKQMGEDAQAHLAHAHTWTDKEKERAAEEYADKDHREQFYRFFRELATLYDILSPDASLHPFIKDYEALARLYALIRNAYDRGPYVDRDLAAKTRELLHQTTVVGEIQMPYEIHELGPAELEKLRQSDASDHTKVLNLRKVLGDAVDSDAASQPFLIGIGERAEQAAARYEDRQITTQQALALFGQLAQEVVTAEEERARMGISARAFGILSALRIDHPHLTPDMAAALERHAGDFPDAHWDPQQEQQLRIALLRELMPAMDGSPGERGGLAARAAGRVLDLLRA